MKKIKENINNEIKNLLNLEEKNLIPEIKIINKPQINFKKTENLPEDIKDYVKIFILLYEGLVKSLAEIQNNYTKFDCAKQINEIKTNLDNFSKINETINININYPNKDIQLQDETQKKFKKLYDRFINEYESSNIGIIDKFKYLFDSFKNLFLNVTNLGETVLQNITNFENVGENVNKNDDETKVSNDLKKILKTYTKSSEDFRKFDDFFKQMHNEEEKWEKEDPFRKLGKKANEINTEIDKFKRTFSQIENYFPKIEININSLEQIFNILKAKIKIFQNYRIKEIPIGNDNKMRIDILIILDTTNSMGKYLKIIKKELKTIKKKIEENCPLAIIYMGFIGYKDFSDLELGDEYTDIDFTINIDDIYNSIKDLEVDGGGDIPEDLAGGLELALKKSWGSGQKLAIIITDAPCHGLEFHDLDQKKKKYKDNYPNGFYESEEVDDEFKRRDINTLIEELAKKEISLVCLDILKFTEKMFNKFKKIYEKKNKSELFSIEKGNLDEIIIKKATELCKKKEDETLNFLKDKYKENSKKLIK